MFSSFQYHALLQLTYAQLDLHQMMHPASSPSTYVEIQQAEVHTCSRVTLLTLSVLQQITMVHELIK